jgi:hypothetical protein
MVAENIGSDRSGFSPASFVIKDRLYLNIADSGVLRLKEKGDGWEAVGKVPTLRVVHQLVPWGNEVLAFGGPSEKGNVGVIEVAGKK